MIRAYSISSRTSGPQEAGVVVHDLEEARDREMARRVRKSDEDAFRTLFRRYGPAAKALAARIVGQPFMAEEIVQEAFLAFWRAPEGYREDRGAFRAWIMSAVHHRAVDMVRREEAQRRRATAFGATEAIQEDVAEAVTEEADIADQRARVRAALQRIPPEQRDVLELMYLGGRTQSRIAEDLGLPLGTVKSRTVLGMRRLRAMLVEGSG